VLQQPQYRGKALPADHPDSKLIQKIAERIIAAVEEGHGGGFQKHVEKFDWEVVVINEETVNAFVLPGGKIVVFTGVWLCALTRLVGSCCSVACIALARAAVAVGPPRALQEHACVQSTRGDSSTRVEAPTAAAAVSVAVSVTLPSLPLPPCRSDQAVQPQRGHDCNSGGTRVRTRCGTSLQ
jgi:predicted Zn-dependent protease